MTTLNINCTHCAIPGRGTEAALRAAGWRTDVTLESKREIVDASGAKMTVIAPTVHDVGWVCSASCGRNRAYAASVSKNHAVTGDDLAARQRAREKVDPDYARQMRSRNPDAPPMPSTTRCRHCGAGLTLPADPARRKAVLDANGWFGETFCGRTCATMAGSLGLDGREKTRAPAQPATTAPPYIAPPKNISDLGGVLPGHIGPSYAAWKRAQMDAARAAEEQAAAPAETARRRTR